MLRVSLITGKVELMTKPNKHHTYLIAYDTENECWFHDVETESAFLDQGTIYNKETGQWEHAYKGEGEYDPMEGVLNDTVIKMMTLGDWLIKPNE